MPNRTALFGVQQPGGALTVQGLEQHPRNVWFVDSAAAGGADAVGSGQHPDTPFLTLAYAFSSDLMGSGDVCYVMPGHAETISAAQGIIADIAGVRVIGLGWGGNRPTISFTTAAGATFEVNADNLWIENLLFLSDFTNGITAGVDVKTGSDDLVFKNCEWRETVNTKEFLVAVTIEATISRVTFDGCRFRSIVGGDSLAAIKTEGAALDLRILNCSFNGDWLDAVIDLDATAVTHPEVGNCMIRNADPTNGFGITVDAATIGTFWNLHILTQKANTVPIAVVTASFFSEVYGTDVAATNAIVLPAAATAWS